MVIIVDRIGRGRGQWNVIAAITITGPFIVAVGRLLREDPPGLLVQQPRIVERPLRAPRRQIKPTIMCRGCCGGDRWNDAVLEQHQGGRCGWIRWRRGNVSVAVGRRRWNAGDSGLLRRHIYAFCSGRCCSDAIVKRLEEVLHRGHCHGKCARSMMLQGVGRRGRSRFQVQDVMVVILFLEIQFSL